MEKEMFVALLDSIVDPVVLADLQHIIRYANPAAEEEFRKFAKSGLVGNSLLRYHNSKSNEIISEILESFQNGENERFLYAEKTRKVFMRAVRDQQGNLIGYYERYEKRAEKNCTQKS